MCSKRHEKRLIKKEINAILNSNIAQINNENVGQEQNINKQINKENVSKELNKNNQNSEVDELQNICAEIISGSEDSLISDINKWAVDNNITRAAFNDLLRVLNKWHISVPTCAETLIVRQTSEIKTVHPGSYLHIGLEKQLRRLSPIIENMPTVVLDIGIDGLPLFKSSAESLWPILGKLFPQQNTEVLLFGVYLGKKKPANVDDFMHDFVVELLNLMTNGMNINGKIVKVQIRAFICDSPAKAFLCQTLGHNALHGCTRCCQVGRRINNRTVYSICKGLPRTNESFTLRTGENYHNPSVHGMSLIEKAGIQMVTQFALDPMHLIDLGVVKKMLFCILNGNCNFTKLSKIDKENLSKKMLELNSFIPIEFARKPRSFDEIKRWKSVEFRQFVLYTGILVLKNSVDNNVYDHFILLHAAYRILLTEKKYEANLNVVNDMLQYFVELFPVIYNEDRVSFNVHSLLHITECVEQLGFLDSFTAYCFENRMQKYKKYVKKPTKILEQINNKDHTSCVTKKEKCVGPKTNKFGEIISFATKIFTLKLKAPDNIFFAAESPFQVVRFVKEHDDMYIIGRRFENCKPFFEKPMNSQIGLGIITSHITPSTNEQKINIKNVDYKLVYFPFNDNKYLFIPLLHTINK